MLDASLGALEAYLRVAFTTRLPGQVEHGAGIWDSHASEKA
jgi:hypothetical protein